MLLPTLLALLPLLPARAGPHNSPSFENTLNARSNAHTRKLSVHSSRANSTSRGLFYNNRDEYRDRAFFDQFSFFSNNDPTHGLVNYLDQASAESAGLAYVRNDGATILKVDDTTDLAENVPRNSVRIVSKKSYDSGLFIFDFAEAPYGCAVWPALWTVGPDWPNNGEIDIFEGVHFGPTNQHTLHTAAGCTTDTSRHGLIDQYNVEKCSATVGLTDCGPSPSNSGCYFVDNDPTSYGPALNAAGGAVLAMQWNDDGIRIWNFPRGHVPLDITLGHPIPDFWPDSRLKAAWASSTCSTKKYFRKQSIVINTTLCGDWAGNTYISAGCPATGASTCAQQVMKGSNFGNAAWALNSVSVYY